MKRRHGSIQFLLFAVIFTRLASAQGVVIENATVHALGAKGTVNVGSVWIEGGRIKGVGEKVVAPAGAVRVDGKGKIVTPGFFDAYSQVGVSEIPSIATTNDSSPASPDVTAAFDVAQAFNPDSTLIPVTRVEGITRILCAPAPGNRLFAGLASVVSLGDGKDRILAGRAGMVLLLGEKGQGVSDGSRATALVHLRQIFADVRDYLAHTRDYQEARRRKYAVSQADLEALVPVVTGRVPIVAHVEQASDIDALLKLKSDFSSTRWILLGATEGWMRAREIAAAKVPVIVAAMVNNPYRFEQRHATLENAARLQKAGATVAFTYYGDDAHNSRALRFTVGNAVANGLPWIEGLKGLTVNPAKIYGVDGDYGTLEVGKTADVVLWSGDPLDVTSVAEKVWIAGKEISPVTRQTRLRDRYRNLAPEMPFAYQAN